ncbi:alpha-amylase / pullulanase [Pyrobaculum islandicum DSM 4184]|uniref:Alpha-amylase / pullulanase n=2 Tax=Pyrobaculum islandicum TaxID=2277 RepID=A1RT78_PYRIL|nr:alpha-amylase / pullulanase [Pyrobaculum islandicum DSM 4184]
MAYYMRRIILFLVLALFLLAQPMNIIFVFHNHQPWYIDLEKGELLLPWVRIHSVGNYLKVPLLVNQSGVSVAYTLSGSLIEQINWYANRTYVDARYKISQKIAEGKPLTLEEKYSMLLVPGGFFDINWQNIVYKHPRYTVLLGIRNDAFSKCPPGNITCIVSRFSEQDFIDLATLFNLLWIDPYIARQYPDVWAMRNKTSFTRNDLKRVLEVHMDLISKVLPLYRALAQQKRVELVLVPYSHPLMPLLADMGALEDLKVHIRLSQNLFERYLGVSPTGVWPPEQAVNDDVLRLFTESGFLWTITDEDVLKATMPGASHFGLYYVDYGGRRIYVFFRDKTLSDGLGFRYASMKPEEALADFMNYLKRVPRDECSVVVVALDGENPWENYPNFGDDFLIKFFGGLAQLEKNGTIKLWKPTDFVKRCSEKATPLPQREFEYFNLKVDISVYTSIRDLPTRIVQGRIAEGSWSSGGSLAIWIGDVDENVWWMWLKKAREDVGLNLKWDVLFPLLVAEASDWPFWYGGEMGSPQTFDPVAKSALIAFYRRAGLQPPMYLFSLAYPGGTPREIVGRGDGKVALYEGLTVYVNTTHIWIEGAGCGVVYFSNPTLPRSPYFFRGAVYGIHGEKLHIYADMAIDSCNNTVYLSDGGKFYPVGKAARSYFIGAQPGDKLYVEFNGLVYVLTIPESPVQQKLLMEVADPPGDDFGTGKYRYPKNPVFKPGVFDLLGFTLYDLGDRLRFMFRVREFGGNPWSGPAGFSLQFFHVYINRGRGERNDTLGLGVTLCKEAMWDVALLIGPGWSGGNRIVYSDGSFIDDAMAIRPGPNNTIVADVPKKYIGEFEKSWKLTVFLTSWDGYGPDNIRRFGVVEDEWTVGGADAAAVLAGVAPRVFDVLAPTVDAQVRALTSYKVSRLPNGTYVGAPASVCIFYTQEKPAATITATITTTVTQTSRETVTTTQYLTETQKETVREVNWVATAIVSVLAFILGLTPSLLAKRER